MVSMGGLPCTSFERDMTMQEIEELEQELEKLENQLDSPVRESLLSKTRGAVTRPCRSWPGSPGPAQSGPAHPRWAGSDG